MSAVDELSRAIAQAYEHQKELDIVSPASLATEAMTTIGFPRDLHELGYMGCHLNFRQMARGFCRRSFEPSEDENKPDLFSGTLQDRYPRQHQRSEEPIYVLRDCMTYADVAFNVARMRASGEGLLKHADALELWGRKNLAAS